MFNIIKIIFFICILCIDNNSYGNDNIKAIINRINDIKGLKVDFIQYDSYGNIAKGKINLYKPSKITIEYSQPNPLVIINNNNNITYYDIELDQVSYFKESNDLFKLLSSNNLNVKNVKNVKNEDNDKISFEIYSKDLNSNIKIYYDLKNNNLNKFSLIQDQSKVDIYLTNHSYYNQMNKSDFYFNKNNYKK